MVASQNSQESSVSLIDTEFSSFSSSTKGNVKTLRHANDDVNKMLQDYKLKDQSLALDDFFIF